MTRRAISITWQNWSAMLASGDSQSLDWTVDRSIFLDVLGPLAFCRLRNGHCRFSACVPVVLDAVDPCGAVDVHARLEAPCLLSPRVLLGV